MHPSDKKAKYPAKVAILNYNEATKDARVWKQALSLSAAGHDVTVYCDWRTDDPATENRDGIQIKRFRCYNKRAATPEMLDKLTFLKQSGEVVRHRYQNLIQSQLLHRRIQRELARILNQAISVFSRQKGNANSSTAPLSRFNSWHSLNAGRSVLFADNLFQSYSPDEFDIIHAHDIYTLPAGVLLARACGAKLIYDAHEYEPERVTLNEDDRIFTLEFEDDCLEDVDALITVSSGIAKLYAKRFHGPEPTLIFNTPAMVKSDQQRDVPRLRERLDLGSDLPLVVFIGGIQRENRGVDKLVKALTLLPGYHLVNLGPRHPRNDSWLRGIAEDAGVSDRVHYLDPVPAQDVPHVVSDASVAASASQNLSLSYLHSMPNKLFEAAFAEVPLCVPDRPDQKAFVEKLGIGRTMDQTDVESIAETLKDTVENPQKFEMTDDRRARLTKEYGWAAQVERLIDLYDSLSNDVSQAQDHTQTST